MAESALIAATKMGDGDAFYAAKLATARFFAERILTAAPGLLGAITAGAGTLGALPEA